MDIKEAFEELKIIYPEGYISIDYTLNRFSSGDEEEECSIYIEDIANIMASTFKEALDQVKEKLRLKEVEI